MVVVQKKNNMPKFKKNPNPIMKKGPFKMKGYAYPGKSPIKKDKNDADELVAYTDPNYQPDWGSAPVSNYEKFITKGEDRLRKAGAPKEVIEEYRTRQARKRRK